MRGTLLAALAACALASACSSHDKAAHAADPHPSGSVSPSAAVPADQVPEGFTAASATFVSDRTGWVLGSVPCPGEGADCGAIARTTDGGRTWHVVSRQEGVGQGELRFADARNGFLLAGGLSATHDGGRTWVDVDTLRDAIHEPWSAEAARGQLWLTGRVDHGGRGLWVGSVRRASFDFAPVDLPDGDADDLLLSLHGRAVVLTYLDQGAPRVVVSEDGDLFTSRGLPCTPSGPLAMRTTRSYVLACGTDVLTTADAARTWHELTAPASGRFPLVTPRSLFVAGDDGLQASRDGGRTWDEVLDTRVRTAGFESAQLGFAIDDHGVMRLSRDDGRTWERVDFRRTK